jgi:multicomponent Na+:H+ antiporter subunit G
MKEIISVLLLFLGSMFVLIASIGLLRFRETFTRLHATTKATSFGLLMIIAGVGLFFLTAIVVIKSVLVIVFIYLTAPLAAHSISKASDKEGRK